MINRLINIIFKQCRLARRPCYTSLAFILPVTLMLLSSCFKEKPLQPPNSAGIGQTAVIPMGPNYTGQYFFSLATNQILSSNSRFAYDLMFDCDADHFHIWLNTAKFMSVIRTTKTDLNSVTIQDTTGQPWYFETGDYNVDSNAIGQWYQSLTGQPASKGLVYVVSLGVDTDGNPLGTVKMQVNNFSGSEYSVTFEDFGSTQQHTITIPKDANHVYRYITFDNGGSVVDGIEPDKTLWDLCFTHYTVIFYEPYYLPYQVTGVLTNPTKVTAYVDSSVNYDSVRISDFAESRLLPRRDCIGYEWKRYTVDGYIAKPYMVFFVKAGESEFYKLHFISFNNANLVKGYPTFEYLRL